MAGVPAPLPASGLALTKFASEYIERRSPSWKSSTEKATKSYFNSAILPALGQLRVGSVLRADIARFFQEYGRRKPGSANRSHDILRNMFDRAIEWDDRPEAAGNPCKGVVRYRRPPRGLLGKAARELLNRLAKTASGEWGLPGDQGEGPLSADNLWRFGIKVRNGARIMADAPVHDLRHAHPSHAVMNGESLHVPGRLLGHRRDTATNRYVYLDESTLSDAAERVAVAIQRKLVARCDSITVATD